MKKNELPQTKFCCLIIALIPILQLYGFSFLTFADISVMILIFISVLRTKRLFNPNWLLLTFYLLLQPFLVLGNSLNPFLDKMDTIGSAWRLALFAFTICALPKEIVSANGLRRAFRIVGCINAVYAVLQFGFGTFFKISLSPYIPFLPISRTGLEEQQLEWITYGWTVRARGFCAEPSHLAIYLLLALALEFFQPKKNKLVLLLYSLGIFISLSSTGLVGLAFLLTTFVFVNIKTVQQGLKKKQVLVGGSVVIIVFMALAGSGYLGNVIEHLFGNGGGLTSQSHFSSVSAAFVQAPTLFETLFGRGMQEVASGYTPGWIRVYYCLGIFGLLCYLVPFCLLWWKANKFGRAVLLTFIFLNVGTEIMCGPFLLLYTAVTMAYRKQPRARIIDKVNRRFVDSTPYVIPFTMS